MSPTRFSPRASRALALCALAALMLSIGAVGAAASPRGSAPPSGRALQRDLNDLLARVAGPGKAFVVVHQVTDRNRTRATSLRYARTATTLAAARSTSTWQGAALRSSNARWAHGQTLTSTTYAAGAVTRLSIALVVDRSITKATTRKLAAAITTASASGLRRARGDRLSILRTKLPPAAATRSTATPAWRAVAWRYGRVALIGLAALAFLLVASRQVRRGRRVVAE